MHPGLTRMRPAQQRAKTLLDLELGAIETGTPAPTSHADREALEHAYRLGARELLDDTARVWLEWIETAATLKAYGQEPVTDPPPQPERVNELHQLVTLAHNTQHAAIVPVEPEPDDDGTGS